MFQHTLGQMVRKVDGALGAAVVSVEGLVIEAVDRRGEPIEADAAYAEYGQAVGRMLEIDDGVGLGEVQEFTLEGPDRKTLIRCLSRTYLAALQVSNDAIVGKAAFELRVAAPEMAMEL